MRSWRNLFDFGRPALQRIRFSTMLTAKSWRWDGQPCLCCSRNRSVNEAIGSQPWHG